jgi:hypothetical protein
MSEPEIETETSKPEEEEPQRLEEKTEEKTEDVAQPKKRGRPPGSRNKPKTRIIEEPLSQTVEGSLKPAEPVVLKPPEPRLFTREEVQSLLLDSCRLQDQRIREEKRERYSAFFRRQKWTQS